MSLPNVNISLLNGQLGQVQPTDDGVTGYLLTAAVAPVGLALSTARQLFSLTEAESIGITAAYDIAQTTNVYKTLKDHFAKAGDGVEVWVMIVAKTNTYSVMLDTANNIAKKLIIDSGKRIRLFGCSRVPDVAYVPVYTSGLDNDVAAGMDKLQELLVAQFGLINPIRAVIDGRDYQGNSGTLVDLLTKTDNRVAGCLITDVAGSRNAAIGLVLGRAAAIPVQRKIARVKDGDLKVANMYLTNGTTKIDTLTDAELGVIHDKGWIIARKFVGKSGYFFNDDHTAVSTADDYSTLSLGRVIDKAVLITYRTYVDEIQDDLEVDTDGFLTPGVVKAYQSKIESQVDLLMTANGEVSGFRAIINPAQNIIATSRVDVELRIRPKGYSKDIAVKIGFENPANA
ncbi:MAG: DUF2586 family protein [Shewanella sp.]